MNDRVKCLIIVSLTFINCLLSAQLPDRVSATQSFLDTINLNYPDENSFTFDLYSIDPVVNLPVNINIIMNNEGLAGVKLQDIKFSMDLANGFFKNAGISFYIDKVEYINDYNYTYITFNNLKKELLTKYSVNDRINLFLADSIKLGTDFTYGFTYFPDVPDSNFIYLNKKYASGTYLTTMLGHYMGLLSTHETTGGRELVSEENCSSSGDYICDTFADPDLFSLVVDSCRYVGTLRDENAKYYVPSVANIMSNSPDKCKCILTPLQYRRIFYYFNKYRQYLNF
jgi:hypothetical protein